MSDLILVQENSTPETVELVSAGPQGPSGTFTIGTITTGLAGSSANVTNTGTPSQAVLNFTIPRGDVGDVTPEATAAKNAAQSASSAAAASQVVASDAATSATASASSAQQSATAAASSSSTAISKAAEASTSAASAASSESVALGASSTATLKASEAGSFATAASTSAASSETSANASASYAAAASGSANASATSAGNASGSASLAQEWATKTISEVALGQGYGAKKYALDAASMAAAAEIAAAGSLVHSQTAAGHSQSASTSADNANTSASVSSDASVLATLRAGQAAESASTSSSQAANASASAATATSQASSATASASTASTQAGIATTKASEASTSASAASVSAAAALDSQTVSAGSAAAANTSAGSAAGSAANALAIYGTTNAQQAALMAAQNAASLAQGFALSASSAIQQDLSGVTAQALHRSPNAVTAMFVYDTSKDSDGGAWTEKCQHTSWYNEALNGKWLGAHEAEFQARSVGGVLGTELITNGNFSAGSTGWTINATGTQSASIANGAVRILANGSSESLTLNHAWNGASNGGKVYRLTFDVLPGSTGTLKTILLGINSTVGEYVFEATPGTKAFTLISSAGGNNIGFSRVVGKTADAYIDNISIREVTALTTASGDYYQSTVDGKFYRLWKNLLSYTDSFASTYWIKAPGVTVADSVGYSTINVPSTVNAGANIVYKQGLANGTVALQLQVRGTAGTSITLNTDSGGQSVAFNGDWQTISFSVTGTAHHFYIKTVAANQTYSFDVRRAQLEYGSTATAYEAKTVDGSVSETFRGNKADFPRLAGIVAEAASVTIYDLTEAGRPMWMRFLGNPLHNGGAFLQANAGSPVTDVKMLNGLFACTIGGANPWTGYISADFIKERFKNNYFLAYSNERLANRNLAITIYNNVLATELGQRVQLAGAQCNAVAMTVLPDAPVDAVTGLQVPTIAVATAGGVSVIRENGSVYAIRNADGANDARAVSFIGKHRIAVELYDDDRGFRLFDIPTANITQVNHYTRGSAPEWYAPNTSGNSGAGADLLFLGPLTGPVYRQAIVPISNTAFLRAVPFILNHVHIVNRNQSSPKKGVVTSITNTFNTGHLIGDIRRAYLADVNVGSVGPAPNLVTNGTYDTDTAGWTALNSATIAVVDGKLRITSQASNYGAAQTGIATVVGKTYTLVLDISGTFNTSVQVSGSTVLASAIRSGTFGVSFVATAVTTGITLLANSGVGTYADFDNISVQEVVADRSYKAARSSITGTLTKTQVALAAQTVAYSGFSAANYLREPYSADLDFGTGEWSASAWVNTVGRKNLLTYSEQFNNSAWLNNSAAISSNSAVAPDGTTTADKIVIANGVALGTSTGAGVRQQPSKSATSITYSESIYAQAAEFNSVMLFMANAAATNGTRCTFNLVTGTYSSLTSFGSGFSGAAASIEAVGGGWYRCSLTTTSDADAAIRASVLPIDTVASQGNGTSGIYVWGAQFEVGAIATDYQKVVDGTELYFLVADRSHSSGASLSVGLEGTGKLKAIAFDGTTTRTVTTTAAYNTATWIKPEAVYTTDGTLAIRVNGVEVAATRGTPLLSLNSRYNLLTKTEDFSDSAWSKVAVTVTTNATTAPDGATTADKIVATNTASATRGVYESISPVSGVQYVIGFSVKASEYSKLCVAEIGGGRFGATFDLTAETTTSLGGAGFVSSSITATGNGWYRCVIVATAGSSGWSVAAVGYPTGAVLSAAGCSYAGDGTSGVFIWGASIVPAALSALPYQWVNTATDFNFSAPLTIGNSFAADAPFPGSIALLKFSATVPTAEQSQWMYEQEKQMFRDGAQVTLPDAGSIVDLTYDDATDKWIAVSATNESEWSGLVRTSVTASPAGSYTKTVAASGIQMHARSTTNPGVDINIPSYGLREELVNRSQAAARLARNMVAFDYVGGFTANTTTGSTAIASVASLTYPVSYVGARISGAGIPANTTVVAVSGTTIYISAAATATASGVQISFVDFNLPVGYEAKNVLSAGATKVEGATKDFTRLFDGFKETIRFGTAPGFNVPVQIQATRSAQ